ncbi:MAG: M28 family peptidase [Saprospiraceae bacterium]|nr:M28 family peptidase [Saprospiraceae bacterium]
MKLPLSLCAVLFVSFVQAQTAADSIARAITARANHNYELPDATPYVSGIQADDARILVEALASKEMQGRETGEEGQRRAAQYIAEQFKSAGLPAKGDRNTYMQDIHLRNTSWNDISLKVNDQEFKNRTDFYVYPAYNPDKPMITFKEVVFVGFGIDDPKYSDYDKADVEGKAVVFYEGEPQMADGKYTITGESRRSGWSMDWKRKVQVAKEKGAVLAFIIDTKFDDNLKNNKKLLSTYGWRTVNVDEDKTAESFLNNIFISPDLAKIILGNKSDKADAVIAELREGKKGKAVKVKTKIEVHLDKESKELHGSNVIGFIEGSDPVLKNEYVLITAHYDHLGSPDSTIIYYGADDNASGTAGVIEIARAFADAKSKGQGPKRSVVCMLVSGEEKGLLGSKFYVDFPIFPLKQTVVDINIDMIGRIDDRHPGNPNYVYVIGSDRLSRDLHDINELSNKNYTKLELDYKYNAKDDPNHYYERSDHYNFAEKGIPAIFYFNGTHPDYHRPTDTVDKIDFQALAKRAQLAFYTAWDIANRPTRLSITGKSN